MNNFSVDSGSMAEVERATRSLTADLQEQIRLTQQLQQMRADAANVSRSRATRRASKDDDLELQPVGGMNEDPFALQPAAPRRGSSAWQQEMDKLMDDAMRRQAQRVASRPPTNSSSFRDDPGLNLFGRRDVRHAMDIARLMQGDISPYTIMGAMRLIAPGVAGALGMIGGPIAAAVTVAEVLGTKARQSIELMNSRETTQQMMDRSGMSEGIVDSLRRDALRTEKGHGIFGTLRDFWSSESEKRAEDDVHEKMDIMDKMISDRGFIQALRTMPGEQGVWARNRLDNTGYLGSRRQMSASALNDDMRSAMLPFQASYEKYQEQVKADKQKLRDFDAPNQIRRAYDPVFDAQLRNSEALSKATEKHLAMMKLDWNKE